MHRPDPVQADEAEGFSLELFERLAYGRRHEEAAEQGHRLLSQLDRGGGQLGDIGTGDSGNRQANDRDAHAIGRMASALTALLADPAFQLSDSGFLRLIPLQRWLAALFGASVFGTADHILRQIPGADGSGDEGLPAERHEFLKFCLLLFPDSRFALQAEALWRRDRRIAASLFLALLAARIVASETAHVKREKLLQWLPGKLGELTFDELPIQILHDVWMHCSYAEFTGKHAIKRAINDLVRAKIIESGFGDVSATPPPGRTRPVILCILEGFNSNHAVYRVLSASMQALRAKFHLVGLSLQGELDEVARQAFDELVACPRQGILETIGLASQLARAIRPDIVYYPSIGMLAEAMFLANLRLAPMQMMALGHPATTHSRFIDYVLAEEDYVGDPACFSEALVKLPWNSNPYRPRQDTPALPTQPRAAATLVRVAIPASVMKINFRFLRTLRQIRKLAHASVEFQFLPGGASGLSKSYLESRILAELPDCAVIHAHLAYGPYLDVIGGCDLFLNPFPFGNTNGIVDTVRLGLPGVCLTGAEIHSHIDEGLFRRLGLPLDLVAHSIEEYIAAALALIHNPERRTDLRRRILESRPDEALFQGKPSLFVEAVERLRVSHVTAP